MEIYFVSYVFILVPFDEDDKDKSVWFLDHDYLDSMYGMFKKVNARERVVGWYHTGPKLHQNDIAINELIRRYCPNSVLVIIDAKPKDLGLPTEAYIAVEEVHEDGTPTSKTFEHVPSEIGAEEAEEVGVEHLLRDIKDTTVGSLSQKITNQLLGLKGLNAQLRDIKKYLIKVRVWAYTQLFSFSLIKILFFCLGWKRRTTIKSSNCLPTTRYTQLIAGHYDR